MNRIGKLIILGVLLNPFILLGCNQDDINSHTQPLKNNCLIALDEIAIEGERSASELKKIKAIKEKYQFYRSAFNDACEISVENFIKLKKSDKKYVLVDVRKEKERAVSMIEGAISKDEFIANKDNYRDHKVITYCTIGYRSGRVTVDLKKQGFDAYNLVGSVLLWSHARQIFKRPDGSTTYRVHVYGNEWELLAVNYEAVID